jgi:hypothetical protein
VCALLSTFALSRLCFSQPDNDHEGLNAGGSAVGRALGRVLGRCQNSLRVVHLAKAKRVRPLEPMLRHQPLAPI